MLLKLLYDFAYSRNLLNDLAFEEKPVRWIIQLNSDGSLRGQGPIETTGKKNQGKPLRCPRIIGDTNSGMIADFLAEGIDGMFGLSPNLKKPKDQVKLDAKHKHFWDQILECHNATEEVALTALLNFHKNLTNSPPSFLVQEDENWFVISSQGERRKLGNDEFTFKVNDDLLLENTKVCDYWKGKFSESSEVDDDDKNSKAEVVSGICLVTGEFAQIARTHNPKIQGVPNTQGSGAKMVSFEKSSPSFSSFGLTHCFNAPISTEAATAYCVALRKLLTEEDHHLRIGQTSICFWAREAKEASSFFARMLNRPDPASVAAFLKAPWSGIDREQAKHDQFYSVTLSGNAGRIVVRHWMQATLEAAREHLRQWFGDLEIVTYGNPTAQANRKPKAKVDGGDTDSGMPPLALYRLACTTVREAKDLQAETLSQLYRATLEGTAPSLMLLKPVLNRLNADLCRFGAGILETPISGKAMRAISDSNTPIPPPGQSRMALLRMLLNRNIKEGDPMIEPKVFETPDPAYNCGRLLAIFDDLQMQAHSYKLEGAGVVERYYGSASSAPNSAFGILWRLHQHHLRKISRNGDAGKRAAEAIKRRIGDIAALFPQPAPNLPPQFPRTFSLQEQGRFALGFYQQMAVRRSAIDEYQRKKKAGELKPEEMDDVLELADNE
ncbi:MAG: type I-C CRISPR-associated protein Cas8c/Csd1 [Gammaproteobacteria bacterium RIFOXYA12_FULL_61_12]|nr:MAG: type I-C CRISPR-associated protein Cas8c/Csd1 [Gammaproteobacteria bacterium RIFOXYA12_FULL_61_12]